jgi:GDP-L-fucose synthase
MFYSNKPKQPLAPIDKIYIAGHMGLVGSAIWNELHNRGFTNLIGRTSAELDLTNRDSVFTFFAEQRPEVVIDAAARVGGILANKNYPSDFLSENLQIQVNLMDAANSVGVTRLLFLGSSCIYPKFANQPIKEESLLTGELEETNAAYAIAKIAGIAQVQAARQQFNRHWISAMPTNLYGPGDNFHPENSHVLPALIRRFHEAKLSGAPEVVLWGSGTPLREFMYTEDMASACIFLLENYDSSSPINIGVGRDISIRDLGTLVAEVIGYTGKITQDLSKPDGTPRKLLDVSKLSALGWSPQVPLREGIARTYKWFLENEGTFRSK